MNKELSNMTLEQRLLWELENEKELHKQDVESLSSTIEFILSRCGDVSYHF